jgi:hypothetical protein
MESTFGWRTDNSEARNGVGPQHPVINGNTPVHPAGTGFASEAPTVDPRNFSNVNYDGSLPGMISVWKFASLGIEGAYDSDSSR